MMKLTKKQLNKLASKEWRTSHLYKIVNKKGEIITFKKNKAQKHFDDNKHSRNIILKSRQLGFTTFETVDALDDVLFNKNFEMLMISYDKDSMVSIFDGKVKFAWDNMPQDFKDWYKIEMNRANTLKIGFGDQSFSSFRVRQSGRSGTFQRVHISEFGKICKKYPQKATEILTGTFPAVPMNGRIDIESTAEGETGDFYEMFWDAWNRGEPKSNQDFKAFFYNWTWDETEMQELEQIISVHDMEDSLFFTEYQQKHKLTDLEINYYYSKWKLLGKNFKKLRQEYPTTPEEAFASSGHKLFDSEIIAEMQSIDPIHTDGEWKYYKEYNPEHNYAIGADVGAGIGRDSSTIVIWDFTPLKPEVVATFADNKIDPSTFAHIIKAGADKYGSCMVAVERNNEMGGACVLRLRDIYNEDMIFSMVKNDKRGDGIDTKTLGWHTNSATKPKMFLDLKTIVNDRGVEINSKDILFEMRTYDKEDLSVLKRDPEATSHWDLLTATAIGYQMKDHVSDYKGSYEGVMAGGIIDML